ncbi:MAG: response regulator [Candidatus Korobacteraceae bacterium]
MKKRRILLVDDELAILLTLRAILEMNGFEVDTAASAKEAQNKLKSGVYEMVIADMRMETETSGYDVIHAARQQEYDPATALLTAYPSLGDEWKTRGAQSLLVKPINTAELLRQLEALLITHQDHKMLAQKSGARKSVVPDTAGRQRQAAAKRAE